MVNLVYKETEVTHVQKGNLIRYIFYIVPMFSSLSYFFKVS